MKRAALTMAKVLVACLLGLALVYSIWQPVLPSKWIIKQMADSIDPRNLERPVVVRFDLSGKGGGAYNLIAREDGVRVVEEATDQVDLIVYMEAKDFNDLMLSLATGSADESAFRRLIISKVLRFAGDMRAFELLFKKEDGNE